MTKFLLSQEFEGFLIIPPEFLLKEKALHFNVMMSKHSCHSFKPYEIINESDPGFISIISFKSLRLYNVTLTSA